MVTISSTDRRLTKSWTDVSLSYLRPAGHWRVDDLVVIRSMQSVGRVVDALFDITIRRNDGGVCVVHEFEQTRSSFEGCGQQDYVSTDELCPHFPGQVVVTKE